MKTKKLQNSIIRALICSFTLLFSASSTYGNHVVGTVNFTYNERVCSDGLVKPFNFTNIYSIPEVLEGYTYNDKFTLEYYNGTQWIPANGVIGTVVPTTENNFDKDGRIIGTLSLEKDIIYTVLGTLALRVAMYQVNSDAPCALVGPGVRCASDNGQLIAVSPTYIVEVLNTPQPIITPSSPLSFCPGGSVTLVASNSNPTAADTYSWSEGTTGTTLVATRARTNTVTISNGVCSNSASVSTSLLTAPVSIIANHPRVICEEDSLTLTAYSLNPTPNDTYTWDNGTIGTTLPVTESGEYRVTVSNGVCSTSSFTRITVNPSPKVTITPSSPLTFCEGGNVTLTASTATPLISDTYTWSNGATGPTILADTAGINTVTVSNGTCSTVVSAATSVLPIPLAKITTSGPLSICQGKNITLTASNSNPSESDTYSWSNGRTGKTIVADSARNYTVTINNGACSDTAGLTTSLRPSPPTPTITGSSSPCPNSLETYSIESVTGVRYSWAIPRIYMPDDTLKTSIRLRIGTTSGNIAVTARNEAGCTSTATLLITPAGLSAETSVDSSILTQGIRYNVYKGEWTTMPNFTTLTPIASGVASVITSLNARPEVDHFSLLHYGYIYVPTHECYTFFSRTDDGSKLYIGDKLLIDNDGLHDNSQELRETIALEKGFHKIRVEYFERTSLQTLGIQYQSSTISKKRIPASALFIPYKDGETVNDVRGLSYTYYEGDWDALPTFNNLTPIKSGLVDNFDLSVTNRKDKFGIRYIGYITIDKDGLYDFRLGSDDGSMLYVGDGNILIKNDGLHGHYEITKSIGLKAGKHKLIVRYFNRLAPYTLTLEYGLKGTTLQPIPSSKLSHAVSAQREDFEMTSSEVITYPNPASKELNVTMPSIEGKVKLRILNTLMQEVFTRETEFNIGNGPLSIDVSSYKEGMYFLTIENNGKKFSRKIEIIK